MYKEIVWVLGWLIVGWELRTVPELSFEKKQFVPALQELLVSSTRPTT
jgi:hypothetical protein